MGNLCGNTPVENPQIKQKIKKIKVRKDSLFTIPELSPKLEFSEAKNTPLVTPVNSSLKREQSFKHPP
jgi:hypothetical protein